MQRTRCGSVLVRILLSFVLLVSALFAILPINAVVRMAVDVPHLTEMAAWSVIWGVGSLAGVLLAGRLTLGRWLRPHTGGLVVALIGIILSAGVQVVMQQWAVVRFGYYAAEFIGWSAGLFALLIGLATASFGVFVAPRGMMARPLAAAVLATWHVVRGAQLRGC